MRIAWFRPHPSDSIREPWAVNEDASRASERNLAPKHSRLVLDDTAELVASLSQRHAITLFDERKAHHFVWQRARTPFDICVYELGDSRAAQFVWPYLLRYPGVTILRSSSLAACRRAALHEERRLDDLRCEIDFDRSGTRPMLRAPLLASLAVAVPHAGVAETLAQDYPDARIRYVPPGIRRLPLSSRPEPNHRPVFGVLDPDARAVGIIERAATRARTAGASIEILAGSDTRHVLESSEVLLALHWPPSGRAPTSTIATMAAGRVPVVLETCESADWPSMDPRTWRPRDRLGSAEPICVGVDILDEEHSLMLAMRRLSSDSALRSRLARAAQQWWRDHCTVDRAVAEFEAVLEEAHRLQPPVRPDDWPAHFTADGTRHARDILAAFGITVDVFRHDAH